MARLRTLSQVAQVFVSEEDVRRGFADVECASHVEVRSNSRCRIAFASSARWFNAVQVFGFPRMIELGPDGGEYLRPLERHRSSSYRLSYRFQLDPAALPGTYEWPLRMRVAGDFEQAVLRVARDTPRMPPLRPA
jgi:hypothetical protein